MIPVVLLRVGGFELHTWGVLAALGFFATAALGLRRAREVGVPLTRAADLVTWTALAGILGARLLFVLQNPTRMRSWTDLFAADQGGLVFYGTPLVGIPVATALAWRWGLPVVAAWDAFSCALPLGHAISRIGCFAAGCCYGIPIGDGPERVPVQLLESAGLFALAAACNLRWPKRRFDGEITALYAVGYGVLRFGCELLRGDPDRGQFLGTALSFSQGLSLVAVVVGAAAWWRLREGRPRVA